MFDFQRSKNYCHRRNAGELAEAISESFLKQGGTVIATYAGNDAAAQSFLSENKDYCLSFGGKEV